MSGTTTGALIGALLALAALVAGFWGFILMAVFMGIGAGVARALSGELDLRAVASALSGRRTS
jgi:uncharacterized membrane protein